MFDNFELRNLVMQGLENDGTFDQIKAQLRSSVFKVNCSMCNELFMFYLDYGA